MKTTLDPKNPKDRVVLMGLWKNRYALSAMLILRLEKERKRILTATGNSKTDFQYAQAPEVVFKFATPDKGIFRVDVWYDGEYYQNLDVTWGPLDADKEKSTVLIRTKKNPRKWVKLWFYDKNIRDG